MHLDWFIDRVVVTALTHSSYDYQFFPFNAEPRQILAGMAAKTPIGASVYQDFDNCIENVWIGRNRSQMKLVGKNAGGVPWQQARHEAPDERQTIESANIFKHSRNWKIGKLIAYVADRAAKVYINRPKKESDQRDGIERQATDNAFCNLFASG